MSAYSYQRRSQLSVTTSLIIICVVVFLAGMFSQQEAICSIPVEGGEPTSIFQVWGAYSWLTTMIDGEIWRIITYQFLHAGFGHLFFNMWALYFFGNAVEQFMGSRRFLIFYLLCGIAGALFSSLLGNWNLFPPMVTQPEAHLIALLSGHDVMVQPWEVIPLVGASGSIYGILIAAVFLFPHAQISLLLPPVTLSIRTFAYIVIGIATLTIFTKGPNAGGEAGHLGGVIMGALLMVGYRYYERRKYRRY